MQENAELLLNNKVFQQQLARKNKLFKKEMKKKFQDNVKPFLHVRINQDDLESYAKNDSVFGRYRGCNILKKCRSESLDI